MADRQIPPTQEEIFALVTNLQAEIQAMRQEIQQLQDNQNSNGGGGCGDDDGDIPNTGDDNSGQGSDNEGNNTTQTEGTTTNVSNTATARSKIAKKHNNPFESLSNTSKLRFANH
ncbi:hypothetical protein PIB30_081388 [Stylosanthes scabra]|uniref:Uncharacterized protein n=1 Tax=Stylosanthes scabra TaxID=79078 RepID=A0ABU6VRC2_9FABA|nr:hypothetical protein [Stylosanthes scabra]